MQFLHLNLLGTLWESQACKPQPQLSRTWVYQDHKPPGGCNPGITWSQTHGRSPHLTCPGRQWDLWLKRVRQATGSELFPLPASDIPGEAWDGQDEKVWRSFRRDCWDTRCFVASSLSHPLQPLLLAARQEGCPDLPTLLFLPCRRMAKESGSPQGKLMLRYIFTVYQGQELRNP